MPFFVLELLAIDRQNTSTITLPTFDVTWPVVENYGFQGMTFLLIGILTILVLRVALFAFRWWAAGTDEEGKKQAAEHLVTLRNYMLIVSVLTIGISLVRNLLTHEV